MTTNPNKICFIICCSNEEYLSESILYIRRLFIPDGYDIDIISISQAESMTDGYQAGMDESDAKYKIYMHQDVFIINRSFLPDTLNIFIKNPDIGMIGMVGSTKLPPNAVMWDAKTRVGALRSCVLNTVDDYFDVPCDRDASYVEAIDGLLMMTQYDVPWRTDLFKGFDFYDVSQSFEFRRRGYKVAVPRQKTPWTLHDCGFMNMSGYEKSRLAFINEYKGEW